METLADGRGVRWFVRRAKGQGRPVAGLPSDGSPNWLSLLGRFQASVMMILNVLEASWSIVVASTQRRFRRVYRRRETSLHPRYKATVVHRVSRRGAGISSDRILSVEPLVLLESAKLGSIAGNRDFSISAAWNVRKRKNNSSNSVCRFILVSTIFVSMPGASHGYRDRRLSSMRRGEEVESEERRVELFLCFSWIAGKEERAEKERGRLGLRLL